MVNFVEVLLCDDLVDCYANLEYVGEQLKPEELIPALHSVDNLLFCSDEEEECKLIIRFLVVVLGEGESHI
jgi:hypothetical protein